MIRVALSLAVLLPTAASASPRLEIQGTCPGAVAMLVDGVFGGGQFAVVSAGGLGSATVPSGPCAGTRLALSMERLSLRKIKSANNDGGSVIIPDLPQQVCGSWVQVLDLTTCQTSDIGLLAENEVKYNYVGAVRTFAVPVDVDTIHVMATGAEGGAGDTIGGRGGYASAAVDVFAGDVLEVRVGGAGTSTLTTAPGGYNGGGAVNEYCCGGFSLSGSGGGASDVRRFPHSLYDRLIVAGGGGGGGSAFTDGEGGFGGGANGEAGSSAEGAYPGGAGGSASSGGPAYGDENYVNEFGSFGAGGSCTRGLSGCGAGGGGWYGGGAGFLSGGGGGAGYLSGWTRAGKLIGDVEGGDGEVVIRW